MSKIRGYVILDVMKIFEPEKGHNNLFVIAIQESPSYVGGILTTKDGQVHFARERRTIYKSKKSALLATKEGKA